MTDFQFISTRNEFWAVPQAGRRLYGETIHHCGDGKREPRHEDVEFGKSCLLHDALLKILGKANNNYDNVAKELSDISLTFINE